MTDLCRYAGNDEPRILIGRHVSEDAVDEGDPIHSGDDCTGCQPCPHDHCVVCRAEHVDLVQTCPTCITNAKERLKSVYGLHKHLAGEAQHGGRDGRLAAARPIPGGDAVVLRGPGSDSSSVTHMEDQNEFAEHAGWTRPFDVSHKHDERQGEPLPTLQLLQQWEDVWRKELGNRVRHRTLLTTAKFLSEHVSWAAQRTDSFPEFVRDISRHAAVLEALLHDGTFYEHGGAPCFRCAGVLERKAADPKPCKHARAAKKIADHYAEPGFSTVHLLVYLERHAKSVYDEHAKCEQGGGIDAYECARCHWRYDKKSYWLAVREEIEKVEATKPTVADEAVAFTKSHLDVELTPWQEDFLRTHFKHLAPTKETA